MNYVGRFDPAEAAPVARGFAPATLRWSARVLVALVWVSSALFGLYVAFFYAGAIGAGTPEEWNAVLPRLYEPQTLAATIGMGTHFPAGGILLLLGPIQLVSRVRNAAPIVHRWIGTLYVAAALLAGLGGCLYILMKGTTGGVSTSLGFGLYGLLMIIAAAETWRHARARLLPGRLEKHRAWAIRLFALAIGSWLFRMEYGFWLLATGGIGHEGGFTGPFDVVMAFFFYIPNLVVAELFIPARRHPGHPALQAVSAAVLLTAAGFVALATSYFVAHYWWPGIVSRLA